MSPIKDFGLTKYEQKILLVIYKLKMEPETKVITTKTITREVAANKYRLGKALRNLEKYRLIQTTSRLDVLDVDKWRKFKEDFIRYAPELLYPTSRLISITENGIVIGQALNRLSHLQRYGEALIDEYERIKEHVMKEQDRNLELEFIKKHGRDPQDDDKAAMAVSWSIELYEKRKGKGR